MRGLLFGGNSAVLAKLPLYQRLMIRLASASGLMSRLALVRVLSKLWMPLGKRVAIIGGGLVGVELAEFLVERGREVVVLEPGKGFGAELSLVRRGRVLHELKAHGVALHDRVENIEIDRNGLRWQKKGEPFSATANQVIVALGATHNKGLYESLAEALDNTAVHAIGDCESVSYIDGAIWQANQLADEILAQG